MLTRNQPQLVVDASIEMPSRAQRNSDAADMDSPYMKKLLSGPEELDDDDFRQIALSTLSRTLATVCLLGFTYFFTSTVTLELEILSHSS